MNFTSVPTEYVLRLLKMAESAGCDVQEILKELSLSEKELQNSEEIPAIKYGELYQMVMRSTHNEWFGMFSGGKVPLGAFRLMCLTVIQCTDLRQAVLRIGEFAEICRGMSVRCEIVERGDYVDLKLIPLRHIAEETFKKLMQSTKPDHMLTLLFSWHRFMSWLVARDLEVQKISVTWSESEKTEPLIYMPFRKVAHNQVFNGVTYKIDALSLPIVQDQESMMTFLRSAPYHLVADDPQHVSLRDKVRSILNKDVSHTIPTAEQVASQLNMSVTTLRRHLQGENTSYQRLKNEARMEAAFHLLSCLDLSNNDIAERLGFDEPSAFFRSFKKWTGQTPGEYRNHLKTM